MKSSKTRIALAAVLVLALIGGVTTMLGSSGGRTNVVGYFDNANGIYVGDAVVILGVAVGKIEKIEPQPDRVKVSFWYEDKYKVPADAKAVILSPSLVTVRALQLSPAYTGGPALANGAVLPLARTAVPVEWDDLRGQLEKLTDVLQPTQPGGVSTLGAFVNTAAANLRGQGTDIRDAVVKLSQAVSALADHSGDLYGTFKNLAALVSALHDSGALLRQLNQNLAAVSGALADGPDKFGDAFTAINEVVGKAKTFLDDNRETLGVTSDKVAELTKALIESLDDVKQALHIGPHVFQNVLNIYQPAQAAFTGAIALQNFANPLQFLCSAVQAASRLGAEQSAKLCVQYMAPIVKNRQVNFLPVGLNPFVGASARPNEVTYSEDWLRPDYIPPPGPPPTEAFRTVPPPPNGPLPPANEIFNYFGNGMINTNAPNVPAKPATPLPVDPATGLRSMMLPTDVAKMGDVGGGH
ncbi:mammalian cell entry protein [Mycobacterium sp. E2327]|uniref:MCE family protein n=1 Tax=Mycobacterium sp. E2327 TaxID=1834132 RepID=UPI0007FF285B|nr:MCE family protein [Mycobacterium sp. E2327]OBI21470.1 mammalian cell entry protein [Mycobacterium sp. E2327]